MNGFERTTLCKSIGITTAVLLVLAGIVAGVDQAFKSEVTLLGYEEAEEWVDAFPSLAPMVDECLVDGKISHGEWTRISITHSGLVKQKTHDDLVAKTKTAMESLKAHTERAKTSLTESEE